MKKRIIAIMLTVAILAAGLVGCGSSGDAQAYVKGILDIAYNKGTEAYVKAVDVKEADAKKYMEQSVEAEAKVLAAYVGLEEPSGQVIEEFIPVVERMYEALSYEVAADGDKVTVRSNQIGFALSEEMEQYMDEFNVAAYVDGDTAYTDEAYAKEMAKLILKQLEKGVSGTQTVSVDLTVTEKDGRYSVSDEELIQLDEQIITYP